MLRSLLGLARACHPEPTLAVTVGSAALAASTGRDWPGVGAVAVAVLASQLATGWHNDWLDANRDAITARRDKPIPAGLVSRRTVGLAAISAATVTVPLAWLSGPRAALALGAGLASALAYNWPLKFTAASVLPYAFSFAALPAFIVLGLPDSPDPPWWLLAAGSCLGAGAHFANVLPDLDSDARTGVRGLPHRAGPTASLATAAALLITVSALLVFGPAGPAPTLALIGLCGAVAVLLIGGYAQLRRPASRGAFRGVLVAALIDIALLLGVGWIR